MTLLEVHVLDFAGDLYGEPVGVRFTHRIRPDATVRLGRRARGAAAAGLRSGAAAARRLSRRSTAVGGRTAARTGSRRYRGCGMNSLTDSGKAAPCRELRAPVGVDRGASSRSRDPVLDAPLAATAVEAPRLARHQIELSDGHLVGVTVAGSGVPLVVVHGFSAEGFLYAQSLSRLVKMGFRVIAIDTAGHGATQGLPLSGQSLNDYAELLGRAIDELGHRALRGGRALDGRPADHPDGGHAARPGDGRGADRRHRRRHVGPDGLPVPGRSAAAERGRRPAAAGLGHRGAGVLATRARPPSCSGWWSRRWRATSCSRGDCSVRC